MGIDVAQAWRSLSVALGKKEASAFLAKIDADFSDEEEAKKMMEDVEAAFARYVTAARVQRLMSNGATAKLVYNYGKIMLERLDPLIEPDAIAFCNYNVLYSSMVYFRDNPKDEPDLFQFAMQVGEDAIKSGRLPLMEFRIALVTMLNLAEATCALSDSGVPQIRQLLTLTERADKEGGFSHRNSLDRFPLMAIARCHAQALGGLAKAENNVKAMRDAIPAFERYLKTAARQDDKGQMLKAHTILAEAHCFVAREPAEDIMDVLQTAHGHYLKADEIGSNLLRGRTADEFDTAKVNAYAVFRAFAAAVAQERVDLPSLCADSGQIVTVDAVVRVMSELLEDLKEANRKADEVYAREGVRF